MGLDQLLALAPTADAVIAGLDAIDRIAGIERSHPSIAYAFQQYQAALDG